MLEARSRRKHLQSKRFIIRRAQNVHTDLDVRKAGGSKLGGGTFMEVPCEKEDKARRNRCTARKSDAVVLKDSHLHYHLWFASR